MKKRFFLLSIVFSLVITPMHSEETILGKIHTISHSHLHNHFINEDKHSHHHSIDYLEKEIKKVVGK